jgi:hypothetical protein
MDSDSHLKPGRGPQATTIPRSLSCASVNLSDPIKSLRLSQNENPSSRRALAIVSAATKAPISQGNHVRSPIHSNPLLETVDAIFSGTDYCKGPNLLLVGLPRELGTFDHGQKMVASVDERRIGEEYFRPSKFVFEICKMTARSWDRLEPFASFSGCRLGS